MTPEKLWKEAPIVKSVEATTVMSAQHMQDMPHHPGPLHVGVVVLLGKKASMASGAAANCVDPDAGAVGADPRGGP